MHTANEILAISAAVRDAVTAVLDRGEPITSAVSAAVARILDGAEPPQHMRAERPAERLARENAAALALMEDMHRRGQGRHAASSAARRFAIDPHDPLECEMLAQRWRRLWRTSKISEHRSVGNGTT